MTPLLSPKDLAEALGIAEQTIYNRNSSGGDLPPSLKLGRLLRFRREDVEAWLMSKLSHNATQPPQAIQPCTDIGHGPRHRGRPTIAEQLATGRNS